MCPEERLLEKRMNQNEPGKFLVRRFIQLITLGCIGEMMN
jgi:hypothetical protein